MKGFEVNVQTGHLLGMFQVVHARFATPKFIKSARGQDMHGGRNDEDIQRLVVASFCFLLIAFDMHQVSDSVIDAVGVSGRSE